MTRRFACSVVTVRQRVLAVTDQADRPLGLPGWARLLGAPPTPRLHSALRQVLHGLAREGRLASYRTGNHWKWCRP